MGASHQQLCRQGENAAQREGHTQSGKIDKDIYIYSLLVHANDVSVSPLGVFGAQGQAESVEQQQAFCLLVPLWESPAGRAQATGNDECKSRAAASDQLISRNTLLYIYITPYTDL